MKAVYTVLLGNMRPVRKCALTVRRATTAKTDSRTGAILACILGALVQGRVHTAMPANTPSGVRGPAAPPVSPGTSVGMVKERHAMRGNTEPNQAGISVFTAKPRRINRTQGRPAVWRALRVPQDTTSPKRLALQTAPRLTGSARYVLSASTRGPTTQRAAAIVQPASTRTVRGKAHASHSPCAPPARSPRRSGTRPRISYALRAHPRGPPSQARRRRAATVWRASTSWGAIRARASTAPVRTKGRSTSTVPPGATQRRVRPARGRSRGHTVYRGRSRARCATGRRRRTRGV